MFRAVLAVCLVACGSQSGPSSDAGSEADIRASKVCDCFSLWSCVDSMDWVGLRSATGAECTSTATCVVTRDAQACNPGETCDALAAPRTAPTPCFPLDAGLD